MMKLDVRPILAGGEEPLEMILESAGGVSAPFEPVPLYAVLRARGFAHVTEVRGADEFVVRFTQTGITGESTVAEVYERHPATESVLAEHGLDLCCGGAHTLEFAAKAHGLEPDELLATLQATALAAS
jgi:regulator of cell morphogenesis and NO signaling